MPTRRHLITWLFGGSALAQVSSSRLPHPNNLCPVCGTVAPAYVRPTERDALGLGVCIANGDGHSQFVTSICVPPSETKKYGSDQNLTRCKNCNVAFWQSETV